MTSTSETESPVILENDPSIVNTIRYNEVIQRIEKFVKDYDLGQDIDDGNYILTTIYRDAISDATITGPEHIIYDDKRVTELLESLRISVSEKNIFI